MKSNGIILLIFVLICLFSCKDFMISYPMDIPVYFNNQSHVKIQLLINWSITDTSLFHMRPGRFVHPYDAIKLGYEENWKQKDGLTIFVYNYNYFWEHYIENQTPDTYLDLDSLLQHYVIPMELLESLNFELIYPDSINF